MNDTKMSKSLGNVVKPLDLVDEYGADALRYYLMRNMVLGQDASFTLDSFIKRYNADLANDYGNLINRIFILINKNFNNKIPIKGKNDSIDQNFIKNIIKYQQLAIENYNLMKIHDGIENSISVFRLTNKFLEDKAPWKTIKSDKDIASTTIYLSAEALRIGTILLYPVIPEKATTVLNAMKCSPKDDTSFGGLKECITIDIVKNIFPRIVD
jgi:methionyl-tRNA synthetase